MDEHDKLDSADLETSSSRIKIEDETCGSLEAQKLSNGLTVMATSEHSYIMEDGTEVSPNPQLSRVLTSRPSEKVVRKAGEVEVVKTEFVPDENGLKWLNDFAEKHPDIHLLTNRINLEAYKHPSLITLIATEDTKRSPNPSEKRWRLDKVTGFE